MESTSASRPLVSILSPCWNGEKFLDRYFACLKAQTYKHLEIVLVNDGSTDSTPAIIARWVPELEAEGYRVKVFHQENQGVCSATNLGLKHVTGDYFLWPDPDDTLDPDAVEKRIGFLESHPEYGLVRCECRLYLVEQQRLAGCLYNLGRPKEKQSFAEWLLDDFLSLKVLPFPVAYAIRMSALRDVNPALEITRHPKAGQNFPILAPVVNKYRCAFMPEPDCTYYQNANSHSRRGKTLEKRNAMSDIALECVLTTLKTMPIDYPVYAAKAEIGTAYQKFNNAFRKKQLRAALGPFEVLCRNGKTTFKMWMKIALLALCFPFLFLKKP